MLRIGDPAPQCGATAVVEGEIVQLGWRRLHEGQTLVLLFESIDVRNCRCNFLRALRDAGSEGRRFKLAVVCTNDAVEVSRWMRGLIAERGPGQVGVPVVIDADSQIASRYGLLTDNGPLQGHVIVDADGRVRSIAANAFRVGVSVHELARSIASIADRGD